MSQMNTPQKPNDKANPQNQDPKRSDGSQPGQRAQTMPGSAGVESPGREELGRSKPGQEEAQDKNGMNRQDADSKDDDAKGGDRPGGDSKSGRDADMKRSGSGQNPGSSR